MKRFPGRLPVVLLCMVSVAFSSCYKIYDYVKQHPGAEVTACRIVSLYSGYDSITVSYNAAGDPTSMINKIRNSSLWQGDKYFKYDKQHRLTEYYWENAPYHYRLIWHRYSYPSKSIVIDSSFTYINDGSGPYPPPGTLSAVIKDSLDAEGRIAKLTSYSAANPHEPSYTSYFTYDAKGNLERPNAAYDNKLNMYHTSRVWMFLQNDYSVNNYLDPYGAGLQVTSYNAAGLPLIITNSRNSGYLLFVSFSHQLQVTYDCN